MPFIICLDRFLIVQSGIPFPFHAFDSRNCSTWGWAKFELVFVKFVKGPIRNSSSFWHNGWANPPLEFGGDNMKWRPQTLHTKSVSWVDSRWIWNRTLFSPYKIIVWRIILILEIIFEFASLGFYALSWSMKYFLYWYFSNNVFLRLAQVNQTVGYLWFLVAYLLGLILIIVGMSPITIEPEWMATHEEWENRLID